MVCDQLSFARLSIAHYLGCDDTPADLCRTTGIIRRRFGGMLCIDALKCKTRHVKGGSQRRDFGD